jgi:hypothetical protein
VSRRVLARSLVVEAGVACYILAMSPSAKRLLEQVESWPVEDQEELVEYAREIEARRTGVYTMSDDERAAVRTGLAEADRGEFVPDDVVSAADKRHDL